MKINSFKKIDEKYEYYIRSLTTSYVLSKNTTMLLLYFGPDSQDIWH